MYHHVFLSYSRKDADLMRRIRSDLQAVGLVVWTDEGIEPGTPLWDQSIETALKNSGCMVVILTPNAVNALGLRNEIHYANIHQVNIFPLLAAGDSQTSIPYVLSGRQWVDIRAANYGSSINQLVSTIAHYLRSIASPEKAQPAPQPQPAPARPPASKAEAPRAEKPVTPKASSPAQPTANSSAGQFPTIAKARLQSVGFPNPLDQVQLLWWLFINPDIIASNRARLGVDTQKQAGMWLVSTLTWLPIFIALVGASLRPASIVAAYPLLMGYPVWALVVIFAWIATVRLGANADRNIAALAATIVGIVVGFGVIGGVGINASGAAMIGVASVVALVMMFGIALVLVEGVTGVLAIVGGVMFGIVGGVALGGGLTPTSGIGFIVSLPLAYLAATQIARVIRRGLAVRHSSFESIAIFTLLPLAYIMLIAIYWFGG